MWQSINKRIVFSLTFIFLVVLLDSQDSTVELQKAIETSDVAPGEHDQPEEVSAVEMNEAGEGSLKKKQKKPHHTTKLKT